MPFSWVPEQERTNFDVWLHAVPREANLRSYWRIRVDWSNTSTFTLLFDQFNSGYTLNTIDDVLRTQPNDSTALDSLTALKTKLEDSADTIASMVFCGLDPILGLLEHYWRGVSGAQITATDIYLTLPKRWLDYGPDEAGLVRHVKYTSSLASVGPRVRIIGGAQRIGLTTMEISFSEFPQNVLLPMQLLDLIRQYSNAWGSSVVRDFRVLRVLDQFPQGFGIRDLATQPAVYGKLSTGLQYLKVWVGMPGVERRGVTVNPDLVRTLYKTLEEVRSGPGSVYALPMVIAESTPTDSLFCFHMPVNLTDVAIELLCRKVAELDASKLAALQSKVDLLDIHDAL